MMAERNLNGISPNPDTLKQNVLHDDKLQHQFNGVHSSQSSRSSSPGMRSTHLPPSRPIPQSQLPPSRAPLGNVTQQIGALNLNQGAPKSSPQFGVTPSQIPIVQKPIQSPIQPNINSYFTNKDSDNSAYVGTQNSQPNLVQNDHLGQQQISKPGSFPNVQTNPVQTINSFQTPNSIQQPKSVQPSQNILNTPQTSFNKMPLLPPQQSQNYPNNPSLNRISPVPPQQNYQISPNRTNQIPTAQIGVNRNLPVQSNTNQVPSPQFGVNKIPPVQLNTNQVPSPQFGVNRNPPIQSNTNQVLSPQIGVQSNTNTNFQNQQRIFQQPPPGNDNQRFNGPTVSNGANNNSNFGINSGVPPLQPPKANLHSNRYPTMPVNNYQQQQQQVSQYSFQQQQPVQKPVQSYPNQNDYHGVVQTGFNKHWGIENLDLLQIANILPPQKVEPPQIQLGQEILDQANCNPDLFRCTMTKIPENNTLLQKSRLPLGVLIHPFRDLSHLPVIQCNVIVRCRACRTYINPFVLFVDNKRWKCNLCYRINELPEEFQYDPLSKTYGDPSRRPEIKSSTLEYIAPAEYMLRPPQPAVYLYLLDVSRLAVESGYLNIISNILLEELKNLPGDARTQIGFIAFDSALHFYSLPEGITQPHEMTILDVDDIFLPTPDNLLVNLKDRMDLIADLLRLLPNRFAHTYDTNSALGAALQVAFKMMSATGGRVTVFQASLPNIGPGALTSREDPSNRASAEVAHLNPANDFYKRLALECSGQQIAVDLFIVNSQYVDIATISGISRFSGGAIHHFPLLKPNKTVLCENFARSFRRYITRKIGFEAVMRIRCTRGLSIHTFHGNFFVRSTDLLSLPNINPDAGFGMQIAIEESLSDVQTVCFQAALLYTSSKGERRIRVHTMCLPVVSTVHEIIHSADQQCIIGLLSKMAVDRSMQSSLSDAREAFINVAIDILSSYKTTLNLGSPVTGLLVPNCLRLLPLYISALLKHLAFKTGTTTRLDDRVMKMIEMKTKPLYMLLQDIYPDLYPIHNLENQEIIMNCDEEPVSMPPRLQLTARCLENKGAFLMDMGEHMVILVCPNVSQEFLNEALGISHYNAIPEDMYEIPVLDNLRNQRLHQFVNYLNEDKPFTATLQVIRDNSINRVVFFERLIEDRVENALSYHEFLQHLKTQVK